MRKRTAKTYKGKPCKFGHDGTRYKNGNCVQCLLDREAEKYTEEAFSIKKKQVEKDRYHANPSKATERSRRWYSDNIYYMKDYNKNKYEENKELVKSEVRRYRTEFPGRWATYDLCRKLQGSQETLYKDHLDSIDIIYRLRNYLNTLNDVCYVVDHIYPLKGKVGGLHVSSGLHVIENLQIITFSDNSKKSSKIHDDQLYRFEGLRINRECKVVHCPDTFSNYDLARGIDASSFLAERLIYAGDPSSETD